MKFSDDQMQQLGDLLDTKLEQKLEEKLEQKLEEKLEQKLEEKLEKKLAPIRVDLQSLNAKFTSLAKEVKIIKRNTKETVDFLSCEDASLKDRVDRIEKVLHLTKMS